MAATANPSFDHHSSLFAHILSEGDDDLYSRPSTPLMFTALATPSVFDPVMSHSDVSSLKRQRKRNKNNGYRKKLTKQERKEKKREKKRKKKEGLVESPTQSTNKPSISSTLKKSEVEEEPEGTTRVMSFTKDGKQYDLAGNLITSNPAGSPSTAMAPLESKTTVSTFVDLTTIAPQPITKAVTKAQHERDQTQTPQPQQPRTTVPPPTSTTQKPTPELPNVTKATGNGNTATKTSEFSGDDFDAISFLKDVVDNLDENITTVSTKPNSKDINVFILSGKKRKDKKNKLEKKRKKLQRQLSCPVSGMSYGRRSVFVDVKASREANIDLKKRTERRWCGNLDYKSRIERQCCLKSAKCFQNFPDDLDEFKGHKPGDNFDPATACRHIDNALLCMSRVFRKEECRATADVVNRNLRDELTTVNNIYKEHCHGKPKPPLSTPGPRVTHSPGGQQGQGDSGPPMTTLVAAGVGGFLAVLLLILIVVLLKKKRRPKDGRSDEKVMFENNSTNSSRYKSFTRKNSEVYAEIDDRAITIANLDNNNLSVLSNSNTSLDTRPLPSAPGIEDKNGYLTPKSSRQRINDELGYDELEHAPVETGSPSYDKLKLEKPNEIIEDGDYEDHEVAMVSEDGDCEYITPTTENGPKVDNKQEDNYHMYFVLEK